MAVKVGPPELSLENRSFLEKLQTQIWQPGVPFRPNLGGRSIPTVVEARNLTTQEFVKILTLVRHNKLPMVIQSGEMGFGFSFGVYAHASEGQPGAKCLCWFNSAQIPDDGITTYKVRDTKKWQLAGKNSQQRRNAIFDFMSAEFFNTKSNLQMLRFYRLELPKERSYYED